MSMSVDKGWVTGPINIVPVVIMVEEMLSPMEMEILGKHLVAELHILLQHLASYPLCPGIKMQF